MYEEKRWWISFQIKEKIIEEDFREKKKIINLNRRKAYVMRLKNNIFIKKKKNYYFFSNLRKLHQLKPPLE